MSDMLDLLIDLLPEFDLPEPESPYTISDGDKQAPLLLAFPAERVGIREGSSVEVVDVGGWRVWECENEDRARVVCREIAQSMQIESSVLRLDFSRVDALLDAEQLDAAREELETLQTEISRDHPDWPDCEKRRRKIRRAGRQRKQAAMEAVAPAAPRISFPELLRQDAARIVTPDVPAFCLLGLFSPADESMSAVDAVWVATVRDEGIDVWAACLEGNPAYEADAKWKTVGTEVELLQGVLDRTGRKSVFAWNTRQVRPLLQNWHHRARGTALPEDCQLFDLQAVCQVAFPTAHRTDFPESLCKQLDIEFRDEMGNGGALAAMTLLVDRCARELNALPDAHRAALRSILSFTPSGGGEKAADFFENGHRISGPALPPQWLDLFLSPPPAEGMQGYLDMLLEHFQQFSPPVQTSEGERDANDHETMDFLKKGGLLEQAADFEYRERADQIAFSQRIEEALVEQRPYVLEAGTGIGKTIGYLVPALLSGKRAFVSTQTKALQDQAWSKDVPLVLAAFSKAGIERTVSIIKGKGNYICLQTVADWLDAPGEFLYSHWDLFFIASLMNWLLVTKTGWLSEIEHFGNWRLLRLLGRDQAPPKLQDLWADADPHGLARDAAGKADVVLANHSYVFAVANTSDPDKNDVEILILDEAHNVDAVVTEVLTQHFRPWYLLREIESVLKRDAKGEVQGLYRSVLRHPRIEEIPNLKAFAERFLQFETVLVQWCDAARQRLGEMFQYVQDFDPDLPVAFHLKDFWVQPLYDSAGELLDALGALSSILHVLLEEVGSIKGLPRRIPGSLGSLEAHLNENSEALADLFETREDAVHWGEASAKMDTHGKPIVEDGKAAWSAELHSTPLDIAAWLKEKVNPVYAHRFYLSATISIGGDFNPIIERLGLESEDETEMAVTGIYPSPFDYRKQAFLGVPHDMPIADHSLRVDPLYMEEQSKHIAALAGVSEGRMLVLFTSRLIMREMQPRLQARLTEQDVTVLSQADANRSALMDRLREAPRKGEKIVLLGLRAFWEGIDVPGHALSVLVVSRLPFEYHWHPVVQAKQRFYQAKGFDRDYFRERVLPDVFLHLRQMYGRLIRSETDRGATVITDPRVYVRQYGKHLLQRLPQTTTVVDSGPNVVDAVGRFLAGEEVRSSYVWGELPTVSLDLSPEQRAIVECPSRRILVRAAAGSGKTHVLITRMIRMIEGAQAKPEEVLALTFTNKAMNVMYERIESVLGGENAYRMHRNILTYHKLAMRIIRQDDRQQETETKFLDESNPELQEQFFAQAREEARLTKEMLNDDDARTMLSYGQNGLLNETELAAKIPEWSGEKAILGKYARFFLCYTRLLREKNLIDYGEAIVKAVNILRENPDQAAKWNNRFKWIFCDEYQDTSPAQATLLQLLGQQSNLFVVGDNAQSIYSWQGSDPDNLRRFEIDFPNTATFNLSKNYRCFPKLVRMSSRFLERTGQAHGIRVEYNQKRSTEEQSVYFLHNEDDRKEAIAIAGLTQQGLALHIPGDPPPAATVGILARKWHLLESIEIQLLKQGIPYIFEGDTARGIVASPKVRDVVSRAAQIYNRSQSGEELGDTADGKLAGRLREGQISTAPALLEGTRQAIPGEDLVGGDARELDRLCSIMADQDAAALAQLFTGDTAKTCVVLSTVHSQKGEEFDTVLVVGLEEGNSPHEPPRAHERLLTWRRIVQEMSHATWRTPLTNEALQQLYEEEEKRIFYVAMTRARYNLVVSRAKVRTPFGRRRAYDKSSFLAISHEPKLVLETGEWGSLTLVGPPEEQPQQDGYRSDGRVYEAASGARVRSKSEMLLANEFTRRGMYYEYEEPDPQVPGAIPDFRFPDYGNIILEHLGLLDDATYLARWEEKAAEYEKQGIRYFRTNEEEIKSLSSTVDRLQEQFMQFSEASSGEQCQSMIAAMERLRRETPLKIGSAIGSIHQGVAEANEPEDGSVCAISIRGGLSENDFLKAPQLCDIQVPGCDRLVWKETDFCGMKIAVARSAE